MPRNTVSTSHGLDVVHKENVRDNSQESSNKTLSYHFYKFANESTVHGVNRFGNRDSGWLRRLVWLVLWLCMSGAFCRVIIAGIIRYLSYPYTVHVTYENIHSHTFPDVTLCNNNLVSTNYYQHDPLALRFFTEIDFTKPEKILEEDRELLNWMESTEFMSPYIKGAVPAEEFVSNCYLGVNPTRCPNITQIITNRGVCYTLSGFVDPDGQPIVNVFPGTDYGFTFDVDVHAHEYSPPKSSSNGVGVKIIIHPNAVSPNTAELFAVAPGTEQYVALKVIKTSRLGLPYSEECRSEKGYSQEKCRQDCMGKHVLEHCGCDFWGSMPSVVNCSIIQFAACWKPAEQSVFSQENGGNCSCPLPCEETTFNVELSNLKYPSDAAVEMITARTGYSKEYLEKNIIEINLYFQSFIAQKVHEEPSYGLMEFAADAGGQMGLFLGASIISMSEFLEFLLDVCLNKMLMSNNTSSSVAPK